MRIALVHMRHAATGGTERYLNHLAAYLADLGHQVTIVCRRHETLPHPACRFEVLHTVALGKIHRRWAFARAVADHMAQANYDLVYGLGKTWTHDVIRLGGGCYQTWMDLVHKPSPWSIKQGIGTRWAESRLILAIEARALAPGAYRRIVTNSEMVKRDVMARYRTPADHISVIHNGVDLERFHPGRRSHDGAALRQACSFHDDHIVLLFLGTGYQRKGLDRLLKVFPDLLRQRPETRLLVVGYDSHLGRWKSWTRRLGLAPYICFLGGRRDPETCYGAGDLYVLPTRYDPFANSTLEALASGLPVITTDTNGGCEVIKQGVHGAVIAGSQHQEALFSALLQWTDRDRLTQSMQVVRAQAECHCVKSELAASAEVLLEVAAKET
jgi:UDP-glucose:(heptosyl)LPS alpha-1,3-glucosyltransferase